MHRPLSPAPGHGALISHRDLDRAIRLALAAVLRRSSAALARLARRIHRRPPSERCNAADLPKIEYHADAAAPEGALYVNGEFVGTLSGITRL
ncbi:hypothetical protein [Ideonella sp.]|uniref:hypothetical protein n=1 Tax=Ideonella sp. TaxID=1929293 RepID=UPI003BB81234